MNVRLNGEELMAMDCFSYQVSTVVVDKVETG